MAETTSHDAYGREWAQLSKLKAGDMIQADEGFTCLGPVLHKVHANNRGLYVECDEGQHYLEEQADDGNHLVGFYPMGA